MSLKGYGWPLILTCLPIVSFGVEEVTVIELSNSQKSIMIDRGAEIDHIQVGQRAKFYSQESVDIPHMTYVGEGEAVKVHNNYSYWYLREIENPKLLKRGTRLEFISDSEVWQGRRDLDVRERRVVLPSGQSAEEFSEDTRLGVPSSIVKKDSTYVEEDENLIDKTPHSEDVRTTYYGKWDEESTMTGSDLSSETKSKKSSLLTAFPSKKKEIKNNYQKEVWESATEGSLQKINSNADPLEAIYGQKKFAQTDATGLDSSSRNTFKIVKEDEKKSKAISSSDWSKIDKDDPRWSQEMNDRQLRRFFVESNIEREINRQRFALNNAPNNEFLLRYVMGMNQKTSSDDSSNQGTAQALDTAYEFHMLRMAESLRDWTLEGGFTWGYNFYNTQVYNARATEQTLHGGVNYYFYNGPSTINSFLWHVGLGMRFGTSVMSSEMFLNDYTYQLSSTYAQLGVKYRFSGGDYDLDVFKMGIGLNALMSLEKTKLSANQPISQYDVDGELLATDMKFMVGMSVFF